MAKWGAGNFETDEGRNELAHLVEYIISRIHHGFESDDSKSLYNGNGEGMIVANIEILAKLCVEYRFLPHLNYEEVNNWKTQYLETYDRIVSNSKVDSEYHREIRKKRRTAIATTFDKLSDIILELEDID